MLAQLAQLAKCLYCVWPALVVGVGWWLSRMVEGKTYYGSLTPGIDPVSPQGQAEFETRRERDKEKRHIIYRCVGIIAVGYLAAFLYNTVSVKLKGVPAETSMVTPTAATMTQVQSGTPILTEETLTPTPTLTTPVYVPTATDRIVVVTQIVTIEVPVPVTVTPTP